MKFGSEKFNIKENEDIASVKSTLNKLSSVMESEMKNIKVKDM